MDHLDQLRFDDIERRVAGLSPVQPWDRAWVVKDLAAFTVRTKEDLEFLLRIVRDYERPH